MQVRSFSLLVLLFGAASAIAAGPRFDRDIAVCDRLLSEARPGAKIIRFGDVGITPERLRGYRETLVALRENKPRNEPDFVTAGGAFQWPGGLVYYRFDPAQVSNGTITPAKMEQFRDSAAEWSAWANLTFIESIAGHPNFITVQEDAGSGGGYSSAVGMSGSEQFLQFGTHAWNRGTICHEVGHALGLWHEQQRTDREDYVSINWDNIPPGAQGNFVIITDSVSHGSYDFYSVMAYSRNALAIDPNIDTTIVKPAYAQFADIMGRVYDRPLSKVDRAKMAEVYGNPAAAPSALVTNTSDSAPGSLRHALYYSFDRSTDAPPVPTPIVFHIPISDPGFSGGVFTIRPTFQLVAPGAGTIIDGATQTAFSGNTNAAGPEIVISGAKVTAQDPDVFAAAFALRETNCAVRNFVINGFNQQGLRIFGNGATGNTVTGCFIGTDKTGSVAAPNGFSGVEIYGGAHGNTVGGTSAAARNVISGNNYSGVAIYDAATSGNVIQGNYIGTNAAGSAPVPNRNEGVGIFVGAHANTVGGTTPGARNIISGNKLRGVVFAGNGSNGNLVLGNYIGTDVTGMAAIGNGFTDPANNVYQPGVSIYDGAKSNIIGGASTAARNVISGNAAYGVTIGDAGSDGNMVQGNFIGTKADGASALGNGLADPPNDYLLAGVAIYATAKLNTIGGSAPGAGNVISGNGAQGLIIADPGTANNTVQGNLIGTDVTATNAIGNGFAGIGIFGGAISNLVGGTTPATRNVISGNLGQGVALSDLGTDNNVVQGNYIGVNGAGTAALGNAYSGIELYAVQGTQIGGPAGARNIISGNANFGLLLSSPDTAGNFIQGNTIGRNAAGTAAIPNAFSGLGIYGGTHDNTIGGTTAGTSNVIANNGNDGVQMGGAGTVRNAILGNSIFSNAYSGIDLFNGGNNDQAGPSISSATTGTASNPSGTDVNGSLPSAGTFRLEFFASAAPNEGRFFVGSASTFPVSLPSAVPAGYVLTATVTDANGNTSPFSNAVTPTLTDSDGDGIPDAWMLAHFGHSTGSAADKSRANDDADGDGLTNLQEYRAGTDPRVSSSRFQITAVTRSGPDLSLTFSSILGKTYRLESKDELISPTWSLLEDQVVAGPGPSTQRTDAGAAILPHRFYRVSIGP